MLFVSNLHRPKAWRCRKKLNSKLEKYVIEINFFAAVRLNKSNAQATECARARKRHEKKNCIFISMCEDKQTYSVQSIIQYSKIEQNQHCLLFSSHTLILAIAHQWSLNKNWIHRISACICMRMTLFSMIFFFPCFVALLKTLCVCYALLLCKSQNHRKFPFINDVVCAYFVQ